MYEYRLYTEECWYTLLYFDNDIVQNMGVESRKKMYV